MQSVIICMHLEFLLELQPFNLNTHNAVGVYIMVWTGNVGLQEDNEADCHSFVFH